MGGAVTGDDRSGDEERAGSGPSLPSETELETVADPAAFGTALRRVREHAGLTLRGMERYLGGLTDRQPDRWSKSKIEQAEKGERLEERWVLRYLSACGVPGPELPPWVMALRRALASATPATPPPGSRDEHPAPATPPVASNLGPRSRAFVGRERVLDTLYARLQADDTATVVGSGTTAAAERGVGVEAVHGLGGVGKTELVREFAHRYADDYELIWWIPAEQPTTAAATIAELAGPLGVPETTDQAETIAAVFARLRDRRRWLLVYDNAEHPDALAGLVPPFGSGHVVVTSRWRAWGEVAQPLRLDVFDRAESVRYLSRRAAGADLEPLEPATGGVFDELADLLGDLPLALAEAAAYLEHTQVSPEAYRDLVRERTRDLFGLAPTAAAAEGAEWSRDARRVATVWSLTLERVREEAPAAEALLTLFAFLAPDDIPRALAPAHPEVLPTTPEAAGAAAGGLAAVMSDPLRYNHALAVLGRYSMIALSPERIGIHRLVQAVVRARLSATAEQEWTAAAVSVLRAAFPAGDVREPATWPLCARLLPHLLAVTEHAEGHRIALADVGWLLGQGSAYLSERGQDAQALPLARGALASTTAAVGAGHPDVADRHAALGRVLTQAGEFGPAREECEEAVRIGVTTLGADDPRVGAWRHTLGRVYMHLGQPATARREWEESLRIGLATLGTDHPDVGRRRNNLGLALQAMGELPAARREIEEALRIGLATLGPEHPTIANWRDSLAGVLRDVGEPAAARRESDEAVRIGLATLGPDHPIIAEWRDGLARVLREIGESAAARRESDEAVRVGLAILGPDHPMMSAWRNTLALILHDLGEQVAARRELTEALRISVTAFGSDHPQTAQLRDRLDDAQFSGD